MRDESGAEVHVSAMEMVSRFAIWFIIEQGFTAGRVLFSKLHIN